MHSLILYGTQSPDKRRTSYVEVGFGYFVRAEIVNKDMVEAFYVAKPLDGETLLNTVDIKTGFEQ